MTQALTLSQGFMPAMSIQEAVARRQAIVEFVKALMVEGTDFGKIPGTGDKPTLLKPGAEKLNTLFGLTSRFEITSYDEDWTGEHHKDEAFFYYKYRCSLYRGELLIAQGEGSCNSWEKKYRYRQQDRTCPNCGKATIIKGKREYGGGWLCFAKKGGCGAKFAEDAESIVSQAVGQVNNPDIADVVNTLQKMSQKRALIAATLLAVNASEFFTQDIEDMDFGGEVIIENAPPPKRAERPPAAVPEPMGEVAEARAADPLHEPASHGKTTYRDVNIQTGKWRDMQVAIANALPRYQNKNGQPDPIHMLGALAAQGVRVINDGTDVNELINELKLRHQDEQPQAA